MFARIIGAAARGVLVALLIALPSLLLPVSATDSPEIIVFMALLGGALTFAEYFSSFPSFVEFRAAPPLNRMRFAACFAMIVTLSLLARHPLEPTGLTALIHGLGMQLGPVLAFEYSPVQLIVLMMPEATSEPSLLMVRSAASLSYVLAALTIAGFALIIRIGNWPVGNGAFNVWVNLPLFDPTTGGDVVTRLQRDGRINIIAGILLPFAIPVLFKLSSGVLDSALLTKPQMLVWLIAGWAFVPASLIMRGLAFLRIAELIAQKRRAAYADTDALQTA
ncbi:hypothetical protein [Roseobacter sp. SK209-2-6]|uniref:hypothetical protein n=1 Tax=Roseobacter sp. SK209-2-6 TaxID=388739 RepID=UPI0005613C65|nr:hypothetical protein [Roseobacter sp. SK209-2-6]